MHRPELEQVFIFIVGITVAVFNIKKGFRTGYINLTILYVNDRWLFSRDEQTFLFWFTVAFDAFMIIVCIWLSIKLLP